MYTKHYVINIFTAMFNQCIYHTNEYVVSFIMKPNAKDNKLILLLVLK